METVVSGIRSTGNLHLGNYFGALRNFVKMQHTERCFFFIADYHSLTTHPDPNMLHVNVKNVLSEYLAAGLDPEAATIYVQSDVPEVAELSLLLSMHAYVGELERTASFKDKIRKHADNVNIGLLSYPVLMAADILLYQADLVPVGEDQRQHVELTRDIAQRFNSVYSDTFVLPQAFIPKVGARLMSLDDPTTKMSKSLPDGCVNLMDAPEVIMKKFKRAVTDCETAVKYDKENKAGISNLLTIYCAATGKTLQEAEAEFEGQGYGVFKPAVGEAVVELLRPIREESQRIMDDKAYLESVYQDGAERARRLALKTLSKVQRKVGFVAAK